MKMNIKGYEIDIDKEDAPISQWGWCYSRQNGGKIYFHKRINRKCVLLHRIIIRARHGEIVDHKNGNTLDNRKSNLRICTQSQNIFNSVVPKNNTSGKKGVTWDKRTKKWMVSTWNNGKHVWLGRFSDIEEAASVYRSAVDDITGRFVVW